MSYSRTHLVRPLIISHLRLVRRPLKPLSMTPILIMLLITHLAYLVAKTPGILPTS